MALLERYSTATGAVLRSFTVLHWDRLRTFGASRLVRSTLVVPVVGYLILFGSEFNEYFRLVVDPGAPDPVNISRLYYLYFGFCCLALGSIVYTVRCPKEVQDHGSAYDFVEKQFPIMHEARHGEMHYALEHELTWWSGPDTSAGFEVVRKGVMRDYFELLEERRPFARLITFLLYAAGVVLVAIPSLSTFGLVVRHWWGG
jgi:hypothetical protein